MDDSGSVRPCRMIQWSKLKTLMHDKFENINPKKNIGLVLHVNIFNTSVIFLSTKSSM